MRIAVLANAASVHTRRWSAALAERGHTVEVFSIRDAAIPGVPVHPIRVGRSRGPVSSMLSYLRLLLFAKRWLRRFSPDVVHAHYATTHGVITALRSPAPVVLTVWGSDVMRGDRPVRRPLRWLVSFAVRRAAAVTSASEAMARIVEELSGVRPEVVRFGVDTARFTAVGRPPVHPFTIGFLKSLHERYAPEMLVESFRRIHEQVPGSRLLMAGDGPMRAALERRAAALGVADRVQFVGRLDLDAVPGFLERIHLLVNPSRTESFGVVLLEAAAAGVATVATKVGGTAEAMIDGETGLLVPPESSDALAEAVIRLAIDSDLRARFGEGGYAFVAEHFEWADCVDHMEQLLERVASE